MPKQGLGCRAGRPLLPPAFPPHIIVMPGAVANFSLSLAVGVPAQHLTSQLLILHCVFPAARRHSWATLDVTVAHSSLCVSCRPQAFLGNIPYELVEEDVEQFFRGLKVSKPRCSWLGCECV